MVTGFGFRGYRERAKSCAKGPTRSATAGWIRPAKGDKSTYAAVCKSGHVNLCRRDTIPAHGCRRPPAFEFAVEGSGVAGQGSRVRGQVSGVRGQGSGVRGQGLAIRVSGFGSRTFGGPGLGFRI